MIWYETAITMNFRVLAVLTCIMLLLDLVLSFAAGYLGSRCQQLTREYEETARRKDGEHREH